MVVADRRDGRERGIDHVGGVVAPAHADLEHGEVGRHAREGEEGRHRRDLEEGDRLLAVGLFGLRQHVLEHVVADQLAGDADALVEAHQMRRGVDMDAIACRLGHGAQIGDQRALAVGAGDMHHRRQLQMRRADVRQQPFDPPKLEVDELGMQPHEAVEDRIGHGRRLGRCSSGPRQPGCGPRRSPDPSGARPAGPAFPAACGDARRRRPCRAPAGTRRAENPAAAPGGSCPG